jgi:hypothetical protein
MKGSSILRLIFGLSLAGTQVPTPRRRVVTNAVLINSLNRIRSGSGGAVLPMFSAVVRIINDFDWALLTAG